MATVTKSNKNRAGELYHRICHWPLERKMPPSNSAVDDISVEEEPSRHVDYLSHQWPEEDIWASWRYVTGRKAIYSNGVRLENASWRTWAKVKHSLGTVAPEKLNW